MKTYPALRGTFGTTEYFVVTMPISELVNSIEFPSEIDNWGTNSLETRYQRNLDHSRIQNHIEPYFGKDEKRFSNSLVLAVRDYSKMEFEPVRDITKGKLAAAYESKSDNIGFLTMKPQNFIPLDGQHRVKAFQNILEQDKESELGSDVISVLMFEFEDSHARYIFNKINKYAKPTSASENLITNDDDSLAVVTRWLIADGVIPARLVNTESVSLNKKSHEFTLLPTFHNANKSLLSLLPIPPKRNGVNMNDKEREKIQKELRAEWEILLSGICVWKDALKDPSEKGDEVRKKLRSESILCRPIGQLSVIRAYTFAQSKKFNKHSIINKLNKIDWSIDSKIWTDLLVKPNGRMMYGVRVATTASKMIAHLVGVKLSNGEEDKLLEHMYGNSRSTRKKLPKAVGAT